MRQSAQAAADPPRRVLGGQRQAGGLLLPQGLGFSQFAYAASRPASATMTSYALRAGQGARFVLRDAADARRTRPPTTSSCTATACATSPSRSTMRTRRSRRRCARGAEPAIEPHDVGDEHGRVRRAAIHTYGDTLHSFISLDDYTGPFLPGYVDARRPGRRCRHPAHRPHRRQRRARQDGRLGRLVQRRARLQAVHQLRRQGHLHRVQRADEHRDVRRLPSRSSSRSTSRPRASARARSRSISTTTAARACSTSRCRRPTSSTP